MMSMNSAWVLMLFVSLFLQAHINCQSQRSLDRIPGITIFASQPLHISLHSDMFDFSFVAQTVPVPSGLNSILWKSDGFTFLLCERSELHFGSK